MCTEDKKALEIKFNSAYYLAKKERPFTDYPDILRLQEKNGIKDIGKGYLTNKSCTEFTDFIAKVQLDTLKQDLAKVNYYTCLSDGSTDSSITEQEVIYVLYLLDGTPTVKYLSIESVKTADAKGIIESLEEAFSRIGITNFEDLLLGLNVDGASVNVGKHKGVGTQLKEKAPWLQVIHCFNHRVELALKDAFKNTQFEKIEEMLLKLYYLYQKSSKRLRELRELADAYEKTIPKPTKCNGTRWIDHKYKAMQIVYENYGVFISHLESLAQTDSQALKRNEIEGFSKKWKHSSYIINIAIFLDILSPLRRLAVSFQQEIHNPVKAVRHIQEFTWTMAKLKLLIDQSLESTDGKMTHYNKLLSSIKVKEDKHYYQDIKLSNFPATKGTVARVYEETIINITACMEERFKNLIETPILQHIVSLLDTSTWLDHQNSIGSFGGEMIVELMTHFEDLLKNGKCDLTKVPEEWNALKAYMLPIISNNKSCGYLDIWKKVFNNDEIKSDCSNVLHIFELLLITPFTNAIVERMFSRMARVKTDWRNRLGRDTLDSLLRISEEGPELDKFDPNPAINLWFDSKVRRLTTSGHKYPEKRRRLQEKDVVDIATITMSDLEDEDEFEGFE